MYTTQVTLYRNLPLPTANLVCILLQPPPEAWSPDAAKLSEAAMTAASQPGGLGTGPRVTLSDTYRSFRVLHLAERNITTVRGTCYFRRKWLGGLPSALFLFWCGLDPRALSNLGHYPFAMEVKLGSRHCRGSHAN